MSSQNIFTTPNPFFSKYQKKVPLQFTNREKNRSLNIPTEFWITNGFGESNISPLSAFDIALKKAEIGHVNLVPYSSIIPRFAKLRLDPIKIYPGSETGVIIASQSGVKGENIIAGLAVAPHSEYYVVYETHEKNKSENEVVKNLLDSIQEALKIRGQENLDTFLTVKNKKITKKFGAIITAIVFNPVSYY